MTETAHFIDGVMTITDEDGNVIVIDYSGKKSDN